MTPAGLVRGPSRAAHAGTLAAAAMLVLGASAARAQPPFGPPPGPPPAPREAAPIDLTGQWVAIVNEDWRWRMVAPPPGDFASVPLNAEGRRVGDQWDASQAGACAAYGAAGLLRMPTRLRIEWDGDDVLVLATDAGEQTRTFYFDESIAPGAPSLQGHSLAEWSRPGAGAGGFGPRPAAADSGHLLVRTTNTTGGWLRRNGAPYSADAVLTEHFDRFRAPNGDEWLMVTAIVEDPQYLTQPYVTSSHFRRDGDRGKWNPEPCDE